MRGLEVLRNFVENVGEYPGVYRMIGEQDVYLYIGKAKNLKKRLSNYLNFERLENRLKKAVSSINKIEITVTPSEEQALLLEAELIRSLQPKYNILLKDDKSYPYIAINFKHPFPYLRKFKSREKNYENYKLFGPFSSAFQAQEMLNILHKNFKIRPCDDTFFARAASIQKPCFEYHLGRCSAPCALKISQESYGEYIMQVEMILKGKINNIIQDTRDIMWQASENSDFEKAALVRDKLLALETFESRKTIGIEYDGDYMGFFHNTDILAVQIVRVRGGNNFGHNNFFIKDIEGQEDEILSAISDFLMQYYIALEPPREIFLNLMPDDIKQIAGSLKLKHGYRSKFARPKQGTREDFIKNATFNAQEALRIERTKSSASHKRFEELKTLVGASKDLETIEVYDNSHTSGALAIGAVIVADQAGFCKNKYRAHHIKNSELSDDYAMIREVLTRRFGGARKTLPDLIIIDGGIGQLHSAESALRNLRFVNFNLIAISKGPERMAGKEKIHFLDGRIVELEHHNKTLHFLQNLRDEAHRFAITSHRKRRDKIDKKNVFLRIPGIGEVNARKLAAKFSSLEVLKSQSSENLMKEYKFPANVVAKLETYFSGLL